MQMRKEKFSPITSKGGGAQYPSEKKFQKQFCGKGTNFFLYLNFLFFRYPGGGGGAQYLSEHIFQNHFCGKAAYFFTIFNVLSGVGVVGALACCPRCLCNILLNV